MRVPNETDSTTRRAAVYRLYDANDALLYIGSAYDPEARWREHRDKTWGGQVARRTEAWYPDRLTAYEEELAAIKAELPEHNIVDNPAAPQPEAVAPRPELRSLTQEIEAISAIEDDAECAKAVSKALAEWADLPAQLRAVRQRRVQRLKAQGKTWAEIGAALGVTASRAQQIASGLSGSARRALPSGGGQPRKRRPAAE